MTCKGWGHHCSLSPHAQSPASIGTREGSHLSGSCPPGHRLLCPLSAWATYSPRSPPQHPLSWVNCSPDYHLSSLLVMDLCIPIATMALSRLGSPVPDPCLCLLPPDGLVCSGSLGSRCWWVAHTQRSTHRGHVMKEEELKFLLGAMQNTELHLH